jgi:Family of unknown function (DUF6491)
MKIMVPAALAISLLVALPAQAQTRCLQIGRIWSFRPLDNRTLIVTDQLHRRFRVDLMGVCPRLHLRMALAVQSASGITGLACVRRGDMVISRDVGMQIRCPVRNVTPLTP